jgi:hypothetical protein
MMAGKKRNETPRHEDTKKRRKGRGDEDVPATDY